MVCATDDTFDELEKLRSRVAFGVVDLTGVLDREAAVLAGAGALFSRTRLLTAGESSLGDGKPPLTFVWVLLDRTVAVEAVESGLVLDATEDRATDTADDRAAVLAVAVDSLLAVEERTEAVEVRGVTPLVVLVVETLLRAAGTEPLGRLRTEVGASSSALGVFVGDDEFRRGMMGGDKDLATVSRFAAVLVKEALLARSFRPMYDARSERAVVGAAVTSPV